MNPSAKTESILWKSVSKSAVLASQQARGQSFNGPRSGFHTLKISVSHDQVCEYRILQAKEEDKYTWKLGDGYYHLVLRQWAPGQYIAVGRQCNLTSSLDNIYLIGIERCNHLPTWATWTGCSYGELLAFIIRPLSEELNAAPRSLIWFSVVNCESLFGRWLEHTTVSWK